MVIAFVSKSFTKVFGSRNDRLLKGYHRRVAQINDLEPEVRKYSDAQLREQTQVMRDRISKGESPATLLPQALAVAREAMDRAVGIRNIFNPAYKFDPATLPTDLQPLYQQTKAQMDAAAPIAVMGGGRVPVAGWMQVDIPLPIYEAVRQLYPLSKPPFRARPFDVQLIGGMVLYEGKISEMKTGEGKTIVAPLACYLSCLEGLHGHVVTVNDYLVQRDRDWVFPFYHWLGLSVGAIHPFHVQPPEEKQQAYLCDVVYGTNSEFGFDYLRDNMKMSVGEQVQRRREFVIIDEVDSILIDEARTPLIISGPAHEDVPRYELADQLARHLMQKQRDWDAANQRLTEAQLRLKGLEGDIRNTADKATIPAMKAEMEQLRQQLPTLEEARDRHTQFYEVERDKKAAHLTHDGIAEAQKVANIGSFYVGNNMDMPHLLENSLRAHAVYQRDKDYVVQNGEVVIVDEFTGRLMVGRQWSDGLHQAVEAKEKVKIKQETQTMATITIQNFFKLYKRRAGMTGTAMTEAQEFQDIYTLEVVSIPTNMPCIRADLDDVIFVNTRDKWNNILDEIKRMHDIGRPVLVGTTSVENSEMLSGMLSKKYGIKHEVLNARVSEAERESNIVAHAGELGAVMIATNMAGRGTDIKLNAIDRAALVRHWQLRNILPREARVDMSDDEVLKWSYRHQARMVLGYKPTELENLGDDEIKLALCRQWVKQHTINDPAKVDKFDLDRCMSELDGVPTFTHHRLNLYKNIEEMGGLHIVGTERHESRRIDNQLRGRAGRQGDHGSSRFFISLEDDLMKLFANKAVLTALSKLGMKEGVAIEHRWITKSVERAQRKVEERNFETRKQLLEYDEVANYQRSHFYGIRQDVLEGKNIERLIFDYIGDAVADAVDLYLNKDYVPGQISQWCVQNLDVMIETYKLREDNYRILERIVFDNARDDTRQTVDLTIGEYMSADVPVEEWDLRGLSQWAMSRFSVDLKINQLRQMSPEEVKAKLTEAALTQLEKKDLKPLALYLDKLYPYGQIAHWARTKFDITLEPQELAKMPLEKLTPFILEQARSAYREREVGYPVDYILDLAFSMAQQNGSLVAQQLSNWAWNRYDMELPSEDVLKTPREQLREKFAVAQKQWIHEGKLEKAVDEALAKHGGNVEELAKWTRERFMMEVTAQELADESKRRQVMIDKGRLFFRLELTQLERFVLLSILDAAWKDHLYLMDQLRGSVSLRAYAEQDPRIVFKREGAKQFQEMLGLVRDRVTDLIFRARLTQGSQVRNVYGSQRAEQPDPDSPMARCGAGGDDDGRGSSADGASGEGEQAEVMSRHDRRAAAALRSREKKSDRGNPRDRRKRR